MAKYYDFDSDYLIEMEARVRHYEVYAGVAEAIAWLTKAFGFDHL